MPCVRMSVHLSVCLLSTLLRCHWTDLCENSTTVVSVDEEERIKFWKSDASGSRSRNFWRIYSALRDRAFLHNLAHISRNIDWIFIKILSYMYLGQRSPY